ncbi:MAG TPA: pitrilysin family protein [Aliidongia sp.]|uniref:M16 family metallopeptidase n=1 Tax=Aliidongia sp. TaxID=1914230 RepID=UPI002DDCFFC3|nr:pitrilysin family protein [Aliidongia sp.]HEV2676477.1 pitrilysin family protein [Aliidongia sp.]
MSRRLVLLGLALAALTAARPAAAVTVERVVSPGGIEAWLVEDHSQKVISLGYAFHTGAANDPADKTGLTEFVASTLDEGAGDLDSQAFQGKLEDLSSSISFEPSQDFFEGKVHTVSPHRDEVFDLLRLSLTQPRFDEAAVARVRDQIAKAIAARAEEPNALAGKIWWRANFPDQPYGRPVMGLAKTVAGITADDLKAYVQSRFGRDRLKVAVVGDLTPNELKALLDRTFGSLPATSTEPVVAADASPAAGGSLLLVKKPVPQSIVLFGQPGLVIADKDYYTFLVVNNVLGGGTFSTRLEHAVREERGLAYSIGTGLANYDHAALLFGQAGTQNAKVGETIAIVRQEWARFAAQGPTDKELKDAKTYLEGAYALGLDSTLSIAERLLFFQTHGLPIDYFDRRKGLIEKVTLADARRVAKAVLDPAKLSFVVVGDPAGVTPDRVVDPAD